MEMIPFNPETVIPDGVYLVKTKSGQQLPGIKQYHYLQARCSTVFNTKKKINLTSVDVSNQTVVEISKEPLCLTD